MRLANLDLNLLVTLQALLHERNVTRAAERLGVSQPAVSAALNRLRRHFDDELLSRVGNVHVLTPLAARLVDPTDATVASARRVFAAQPDFDPARSEREFAIAMSDYSLAVLGDALSSLAEERAPRIRLHLRQLTNDSVDNAAEVLRTTDALVLPHGFLRDLPYRDLFTDDWACLVSTDNSRVGDELTVSQLGELPWVFTYHRPTAYTPADRQMRALGVEPDVRIVAESFVALPCLIRGTERIALIQRRLTEQAGGMAGLRALACPFAPDPLVEALWWHPMNDPDPGHRWLRDLFTAAAARAG
ncbi:DNA-binding transcriptional LysR family regulator [Lipingzhangella halophila]|uniref:DNA-binding transcriptional LysR family regulator n=1 Tax=Lipingzhangella halophila TaxID=1783352 RepID=A0A7W7RMT7_9ACTN|nr:LysR family transcriptional regulator [Lipingzhangella halophila]MBB4934851.1 DNA-binding transcriptional LysR family regulator [Lipingzhangella halophila]